MLTTTSSTSENHLNVLCVDMGSTRTKAAVLGVGMTLEQLRSVQVIIFDSKFWWGANCPGLFDKTIPESLAGRVQHPYQAISLGISGLVVDQKFLSYHTGVPEDLKIQCKQRSGLTKLRIENDAVAWARGTTTLQARLGSPMKYPGLFVTFGTYPGAAVLIDPTHSLELELYLGDWPFPVTNACRGTQPESWNRHEQALFSSSVINKDSASACDLVSDSSVKWLHAQNSDEKTVQKLFTTRVSAFLRDTMDCLKSRQTLRIETVLVGGGNAEWLNNDQLSRSLPESVYMLNNTALKILGIPPELISLMGAIDGFDEAVNTEVFPDKSCVLAKIEAVHEEYSKGTSLDK